MNSPYIPAPLRPGAKIAILSPSGPVLPEHLQRGLARLEAWGFEPHVFDQTFDRSARGYLAGSDAARAGAFTDALCDPQYEAIIFSRGGYGFMRLLPLLDAALLRANFKRIVGFSDITALHLWCAKLGLSSAHGPVLKSFHLHPDDDPTDSLDHLHRYLTGAREHFTISGLTTASPGLASGPLIGGNLSLVAAMLGTTYCPDLAGAILFLEDISEPDYRLDRMLCSLRLHLGERRLGGLVLGEFTDCQGVYVEQGAMAEYLAELAAELECPAVMGLPCGHGAANVTLPIGVQATLDATTGTLEIG